MNYDEATTKVIAQMKGTYTDTVIDYAINTRNFGRLADWDGIGTASSSCGETIQMWIKVAGGKISKASFETDGCAATLACGSMAAEMITGKDVAGALKITQKAILDALGGLPDHNQELALVAAKAVKNAIRDFLALKREPWKKAYRKL
ncbi:MAG: iron-sulfur cluster assembly scaffold protein [Chloroflexi bacterium]|jgi:nitrogen fixation protein NifU and related proteins|nr:iron-sulfur cluster assembly scaffold protein [Chloroflexota bacterium]MBT7081551.1 iron-sulfur cluster assembly scaffold protein [Chloroflexota bacterium]MBT7289027.1 iron-sulfur cluster assembly scaffold protein [Chloroflexota bacterium]